MTTVWSASASLSLNDVVAPTATRRKDGLFFRVTQAGTTGSSEPNWVSTIGETVYDNNVRYVSTYLNRATIKATFRQVFEPTS